MQRLIRRWRQRLRWYRQRNALSAASDVAGLRALHECMKFVEHTDIDAYVAQNAHEIDKTFFEELALHTQLTHKAQQYSYQHGRVIYAAMRRRLEGLAPHEVAIALDVGTARGFSALCSARALIDSQSAGVVISIDGLRHDKAQFWGGVSDSEGMLTRRSLISRWPNESRRCIFLTGETQRVFSQILHVDRLHFVFIDAEHRFEPVVQQYRYARDRQQEGDVILFDDVTDSAFPEVVEAVNFVKDERLYDVEVVRDSFGRGYAIATRSR